MILLRGFLLLLLLQLVGEALARALDLPVPGPVLGLLLLLLALLAFPALAKRIAPAGDALLAHLSLLFIPAGVGVLVHLGRLDGMLLAVAATLGLSTLVGLAVTALVLQHLMRGRPTRDHADDGGRAS